jgi:hypothetical protein
MLAAIGFIVIGDNQRQLAGSCETELVFAINYKNSLGYVKIFSNHSASMVFNR